MNTTQRPSFPTRVAVASRNRDKILAAAWDAFAEPGAEVSMAEIARRAGVGMATLYRNFPGRRELLETLYIDEVDALCEAAGSSGAPTPGKALTAWLRLVFTFVRTKRHIVAELLEHGPAPGSNRARALVAGQPLLTAAQDAHQIRDVLTLEQIFDMIVALAALDGDANYVEPMLETMLDGLRP